MPSGSKHKFLVESALLTHGLYSVSDAEIRHELAPLAPLIAYLQDGQVIFGDVEKYLAFRGEAQAYPRIDCFALDKAREEGVSAALTASGTMAAAREQGIGLVISCGIGGIGHNVGDESFCPDLPALADLGVTLLATAFKDMIDLEASFDWLKARGVKTYGVDTNQADGYLFRLEPHALDGVYDGQEDARLILQPIPEATRLSEAGWLETGIAAGEKAFAFGQAYHPAVNRTFDKLSEGESSRMQLKALARNVALANSWT